MGGRKRVGLGGIGGGGDRTPPAACGCEAMSTAQESSYYRLAGIVIVLIAAAWTIFHLIWNLLKQTADDFWGQALLVLFILGVILAFLVYFTERQTLVAQTSPNEQFPEPAISRFFLGLYRFRANVVRRAHERGCRLVSGRLGKDYRSELGYEWSGAHWIREGSAGQVHRSQPAVRDGTPTSCSNSWSRTPVSSPSWSPGASSRWDSASSWEP